MITSPIEATKLSVKAQNCNRNCVSNCHCIRNADLYNPNRHRNPDLTAFATYYFRYDRNFIVALNR